MNNPEYIVVDEIGAVVGAVKSSLNLDVLNYQYGYVEELNETLQQWSKNPDYAVLKFPLVWVMQPFTVQRGMDRMIYGSVEGLRIFIITGSVPTLKAKDRMEQTFKTVLYPIYRELMAKVNRHAAFVSCLERKHKVTDFYYWGENQKSVLQDVIDCLEISQIELKIQHNQNC